jgi:hypothetical protein
MQWDMDNHEMFTLTMPRFTDGSSLNTIEATTRHLNLQFEPSTLFSGAWLEGIWNNNSSPYNSSKLVFIKKSYFPIKSGEIIDLKIYAENGIRAYCGFPAHDARYDIRSSNPMESFQLISNATGLTSPKAILPHPQMGLGCRLHGDCHERGSCDYCTETCSCFPGWGASTDIIMTGDSISKYCFHRQPPPPPHPPPLPPHHLPSQESVPLAKQLLIFLHQQRQLMLLLNVRIWESVIVSLVNANASLPTPGQHVIDVCSPSFSSTPLIFSSLLTIADLDRSRVFQ